MKNMRSIWLTVGVGLLLAACGGGEQAEADHSEASEPEPAEMMAGQDHEEAHDEAGEDHAAMMADPEHAEMMAEHHPEGGMEGHYVSEAESWDQTADGIRLTLQFDPGYAVFSGRVANTGTEPACGVQVEVHLSTGTELGPTEARELAPGASATVELSAGDEMFPRYAAHVASSECGGS